MKVFVLLLTVVVAAVAGENGTDPADLLLTYKENHVNPYVLTVSNGAPVTLAHATSTLNTNLIDNYHFFDMMGKLVREKTAERAVHAKGTGAFGYVKVLKDISHICKANFLNEVGKITPVAVRFSTTIGSHGSPDLELGIQGFSVKIYTREGNFDVAGFHIPVFASKEPLHGHTIIRTVRKNPELNTIDRNITWDRFVQIPEAIHSMMYANLGVPASLSNMPGYSIHTYQVENEHCVKSFCRLHFVPDAGIKNMPAAEAKKIACSEPDYLTKDLHRRIAMGDYPTWTLYFQCLSEADVEKEGSRAFDLTRILPEHKYPLIKVATLVLNRSPRNHLAEIEQLAFCPCHVVPGIAGAPDQVFKARSIIYKDAQHYRLGGNYHNIPVNCPFQTKAHTYHTGGMPLANVEKGPNYYPNSFNGPQPYEPQCSSSLIKIIEKDGADNFDQMKDFYTKLKAEDATELVKNLATTLKHVATFLQEEALKLLCKIHEDFGERMAKELNVTSKCC